MKTNFLGKSLAVLGYWAFQVQDVLAQASAPASAPGGDGTFGRGPIIVWAVVVGAAVIGFGVGYAVGSARSNSSSQ